MASSAVSCREYFCRDDERQGIRAEIEQQLAQDVESNGDGVEVVVGGAEVGAADDGEETGHADEGPGEPGFAGYVVDGLDEDDTAEKGADGDSDYGLDGVVVEGVVNGDSGGGRIGPVGDGR